MNAQTLQLGYHVRMADRQRLFRDEHILLAGWGRRFVFSGLVVVIALVLSLGVL